MPQYVKVKVSKVEECEVEIPFPCYRVVNGMGEEGESAIYWKIDADGTYTTIDKQVIFKHYMKEREVRYEIHRSVECRGNLEGISTNPEFWSRQGKYVSNGTMFWAMFEEAVAVVASQFPEKAR